jgi:hypothetical protein
MVRGKTAGTRKIIENRRFSWTLLGETFSCRSVIMPLDLSAVLSIGCRTLQGVATGRRNYHS